MPIVELVNAPMFFRNLAAGAVAVGLALPAAHADDAFLGITAASTAILAAGAAGDLWLDGAIGYDRFEEKAAFAFGAGLYDVIEDNEGSDRTGLARIEYRFGSTPWSSRPFIGAEITGSDSVFVFGGLLTDVYLTDNFVLTPSVAIGYYDVGDARDLGSILEFRTGIEAMYRLESGVRFGFAFYHISNAEIADRNPGIETLTFNVSIPMN